jgi:hypothetical protein
LIGADDTIKALKETYKDMFTIENSNSNHTPPPGSNNNNPDDIKFEESFFEKFI